METLLTATSLNKELDNVGYSQDPYRAFKEFLHALQKGGFFIYVYRFLYTWKVHNSRIDLVFANQKLINGIREMNHT